MSGPEFIAKLKFLPIFSCSLINGSKIALLAYREFYRIFDVQRLITTAGLSSW